MRETEFRDWLRRRSYKGSPLTAKGVNNRVRKAPRIERALKELGFVEPDLDTLHAKGRWPDLVKAVSKIASDWQSNEAAARKMAPQAPDPSRQLTNLINVARQYGHFAEGKDPNYDVENDEAESEEIEEIALEALKARFQAAHPDFESNGGFEGRSTYHFNEDDYKRALIEQARRLMDDDPHDLTALGGALLDLVLDDKVNLVGDYRRKNHIRAVRGRSGARLQAAVGALAMSIKPPAEAAADFVGLAWPLVLEGSEQSQPYADVRVLATLFQALARPDKAIALSYTRFHNLGVALLGRSLFGNNPLTAAEYEEALTLSGELFAFMRDWGWHPRDLWDVQGFIWVTCKEKLDMDDSRAADRIRQYALETYLIPARERGERTVTIRCGDVHNALGMTNAHANVCQALRGRKFKELAEVDTPSFTGPDNSSTTKFTYQLSALGGKMAPVATEATNLILYGPPGTGKTWRTAAEAVRLCDGLPCDDPLVANSAHREALMARYRQLMDEDRIGFVTFHQNYSYEDFVEGLRPTTLTEDGVEMAAGFRLHPEPGAFRKYAELAEALGVEETAASVSLENRKIFKMSLGEVANPEDDYLFDEAIEQGFIHMGDDSGIDWSEPAFDTKVAMIDAYATKYPERPVLSQLSGAIEFPFTLRHRVRNGDIIIVSKGNLAFRAIGEVIGEYENVTRENDDYVIRRAVKWHWINREGLSYTVVNNKRFSQRTVYELARSELKIEALQSLLDSSVSTGPMGLGHTRSRNFVLIIDEINRANISKVFGELITLIEPDKRIGRANELRVLLPYSKKWFGVPANLHIVGTMNTADRSIALLDTALRRRFVFREVGPDLTLVPEQVDGVPLRRVLEVINDRIEYLIDREHRVGHAFFMGDGGLDRPAIDRTMRDKVIPLLQEYFFEDWSRVAAVLGERRGAGGAFLDCRKLKDPTGQDGEERESWIVRGVFATDAYDRLIGKPVPTTAEQPIDEAAE